MTWRELLTRPPNEAYEAAKERILGHASHTPVWSRVSGVVRGAVEATKGLAAEPCDAPVVGHNVAAVAEMLGKRLAAYHRPLTVERYSAIAGWITDLADFPGVERLRVASAMLALANDGRANPDVAQVVRRLDHAAFARATEVLSDVPRWDHDLLYLVTNWRAKKALPQEGPAELAAFLEQLDAAESLRATIDPQALSLAASWHSRAARLLEVSVAEHAQRLRDRLGERCLQAVVDDVASEDDAFRALAIADFGPDEWKALANADPGALEWLLREPTDESARSRRTASFIEDSLPGLREQLAALDAELCRWRARLTPGQLPAL